MISYSPARRNSYCSINIICIRYPCSNICNNGEIFVLKYFRWDVYCFCFNWWITPCKRYINIINVWNVFFIILVICRYLCIPVLVFRTKLTCWYEIKFGITALICKIWTNDFIITGCIYMECYICCLRKIICICIKIKNAYFKCCTIGCICIWIVSWCISNIIIIFFKNNFMYSCIKGWIFLIGLVF